MHKKKDRHLPVLIFYCFLISLAYNQMITEEVRTKSIVAIESHKTAGANFVIIIQAAAIAINNKLIIKVTINVFLEISIITFL